jgi:hypothetical protein
LLVLAGSIAVLFQKAHRHLYPKLEDERFTQFIIVLLSPANSIRALDLLSRQALDGFHPLALARKFFTGARFEAFASQCLRDLRHPAGGGGVATDPAARNAERWFRQLQLECLEKFLACRGTNASRLALAPQKPDPGCLAYCPRCLSQFTVPNGVCEDCGGLSLVGFEKTERAENI